VADADRLYPRRRAENVCFLPADTFPEPANEQERYLSTCMLMLRLPQARHIVDEPRAEIRRAVQNAGPDLFLHWSKHVSAHFFGAAARLNA
jgi:hypothetical protein